MDSIESSLYHSQFKPSVTLLIQEYVPLLIGPHYSLLIHVLKRLIYRVIQFGDIIDLQWSQSPRPFVITTFVITIPSEALGKLKQTYELIAQQEELYVMVTTSLCYDLSKVEQLNTRMITEDRHKLNATTNDTRFAILDAVQTSLMTSMEWWLQFSFLDHKLAWNTIFFSHCHV